MAHLSNPLCVEVVTILYDKYYQIFCDELHKALGCYLFWRMLQKKAYEEPDLLLALNRTPLSWILTRHALQVTLFMTLGRLFDNDSDAFSADDLLRCCIEEIDAFGKDQLRIRKLQVLRGNKPDWLEKYVQDAYEPTSEDFHRLRGELSKHRRVFEQNYRPIRHKLFAHLGKDYIGKNDELWEQTNIGELETILWFLHDLKETLFDAYHNGKKPVLSGRKPDVAFYEDDFAELLDQTKNA